MAVTASPRRAAAGEPAFTGAAPAASEASRKTVSLVLVSPSTVSWFHVRAAAERSSPSSVSGSAVASVITTASMVAMPGWIMPTPLATPETRTVTGFPSAPGRSTVVVAALAVESVVRSALAAARSASGRSPSAGTRRVRPSVTRGTGRRAPMTPVESVRVCRTSMPRAVARAAAISAWSASPAAPVAALALPLVLITALARPRRPRPAGSVARRCCCDRRTGAAAMRLRVKTAAAAAGGPNRSVPITPPSTGVGSTVPTAKMARSGSPAGLDAGAEPAGHEAGRQHRGPLHGRERGGQGRRKVGRADRRRGHGATGSADSPVRSSRP